MKNRGFTLVELLGVITVLALITLIAVPSITGTLKKQKEMQYNKYLNDLYLATEAYVLNQDEYDLSQVNQTIYIKLEDVVKAKYLNSTIVNPKTNEKLNVAHYIKITVKEDNTFQYDYLTEAPDLTPLSTPVWGAKTITESNVTVAYTTTDEESRIKDTLCYYGKSNSDLSKLGTIGNHTCVFPVEAGYAKVCTVNNSGMYSCSETKQLAEYLIQDGQTRIDFTDKEIVRTQNSDSITIYGTYGARKGIYSTNVMNFSKYSYIYADLSYTLLSTSTENQPSFQIFIGTENWILNGAASKGGSIYNYPRGKTYNETKERKIYSFNIANDITSGYLDIGKNANGVAVSDLTTTLYNVWFQLAE